MNNRLLALVTVLLLTASVLATHTNASSLAPKSDVDEATFKALDASRTNIRVSAGSFINPGVAKALAKAHRRGVRVEVILEEDDDENISADFLSFVGIPTFTTPKATSQAFALIDGNVLLLLSSTATSSSQLNTDQDKNPSDFMNLWNARRKASAAFQWKGIQKPNGPVEFSMGRGVSKVLQHGVPQVLR